MFTVGTKAMRAHGFEVAEDEEGNERKDGDIIEEAEVTDQTPDGGWGWFIVLGSLFVHFFIGGLERSAGIMYLKFIEKFQQSAAATAWATSLPIGLQWTLGPLCSVLCHRYSHRSVVMFGSILLFVSTIVTAFSPSLTFALLSFGVLGGIARCFSYAPAVMIVAEYFTKRRGLAVGIATSGTGLGSFLFPTMIEFFFTFYGFCGAFIILGAVVLHLTVCGSLFRPLWLHTRMMAHSNRRNDWSDTSPADSTLVKLRPTEHVHVPVHKTAELTNTSSKEEPCNQISTLARIKNSKFIRRFSISSQKHRNRPKSKMLDLSLLKDIRFASLCVAVLLFTLAFQSTFVFIPVYAKSKGISDLDSSYIVAITGLFDGLSRIGSGFLLDFIRVKYRIYIYNMVMVVLGVVPFLVPQTDTFVELSVLCAVYGLFVGAYISQKTIVIVDILGVTRLVNSFGIAISFQGIGMFLGPPIAGVLKDLNGHYRDGFYFGGASMIFGAFILAVSNVLHHRTKRNEAV